MGLVKGNFNFKLGANVLAEIDEFNVNYDVSTNDHESLQGHTYEIEGGHKVSVEARFLESDVPSLAVALPQFFVANGGTLSTGETVNDANGAIDIVPSQCGDSQDYTDLIIEGCGDNPETARLIDVASRFNGFVLDGGLRKVSVVFNGYSTTGTVQFFRRNAVSIVS